MLQKEGMDIDMLIHHPNIVKSGLVFYFDPANFKSYPAAQDTYVNNVKLVLDGESLTDKSQNNFTLTNSSVSVSSSQYKYGSSSLYFNGSAYMTYAAGSSVAFGTSDFTVEGWMYSSVTPSSQYIFDFRNASQTNAPAIGFGLSGPSFLGKFGWYTGSVIIETSSTTPVAPSGWTHFAYCRTSSNGSGFLSVNGTVVASGADATNYTVSPTTSYIGTRYNVTNQFNGYLDDIRITGGTARYGSSNFTPPTASLSLPGQIIDLSKNKSIANFKNGPTYSSGSIVFDGSNDYISLGSNSNLTFGTGDFTIDLWYKPTAKTTSYPQPIGINLTWQANVWCLTDRHATQASNAFGFFSYNISGSPPLLTSVTVPSNGIWYNIVITRVGTTFSMYINGKLERTATSSASLDGGVSNEVTVGGDSANGGTTIINGNLSSIKIYKGKGLSSNEILQNYNATKARFGL